MFNQYTHCPLFYDAVFHFDFNHFSTSDLHHTIKLTHYHSLDSDIHVFQAGNVFSGFTINSVS